MKAAVNGTVQVRKLVITAMLVAVCAVCAYISVPLPGVLMPFTLQTMAVMVVGLILKPKAAFITVLAYVLVGATGLPVYSSAKGGIGAIAGPTGGFIWGFLLMVVLISLISGGRAVWWRSVLAILAGLVVLYACGCFQMALVMDLNWWQAILTGCLPYMPGEAIKTALAVLIGKAAAMRNFASF